MIKKFKDISTNQFCKILATGVLIGAGFLSNAQAATQNNIEAPQAVMSHSVESVKDFKDIKFSSMERVQKKEARNKIAEHFTNKYENLKKIGLYQNIENPHFHIEINGTTLDQAHYDIQTIDFNIHGDATLNNLKLKTQAFSVNGFSSEQNAQYDMEKTFFHELGHLEYAKNSNITNNADLNNFINSDIKFSSQENGINTSYQFVHENFGDIYGELAYLKVNGFTKENINHIKEDLKTRIEDQNKLKIEHPEFDSHFDSHDTTVALSNLVKLLENENTKNALEKMPANQLDSVAKAIVLNSYIDYIKDPEVKNNIEENLKNSSLENKEELTKSYESVKIIEKIDVTKLIEGPQLNKSNVLNNIQKMKLNQQQNNNITFKIK